jgi:predicted flap endonuclease-1-like 5' DNA nuclease
MDFSNLFNQFTAEDSIFILIVMLIAFLLGLLLGYVLRSRRVMQLRRELKEKKKALAEAEAQIENLKEQLALKEADLKKLGFTVQEAEAKAERLEQEKEELNKRIFMLNSELDEAGKGEGQQERVDELEHEMKQLRQRNEILEAQLAEGGSATIRPTATPLEDRDQLGDMQQRINVLEHRLEELSADNAELHDKMRGVRAIGPGVVAASASTRDMAEDGSGVHPMPGLPDAELVEEEPNPDFNPDKSILDDKIPAQGDVPKDDLTRIEGIGPFLQQQLNNIGVFTYEEVSSWDSARIAEVTRDIGYFEGRIEKDRWVEQAAQLAGQQADKGLDAPVAPLSTDPSDITIIEGVNEHAAQALVSAGIDSWEELAESNTEQLQNILEASDLADLVPIAGSWPTQARLAKSGDWAVLREYQEELRNA